MPDITNIDLSNGTAYNYSSGFDVVINAVNDVTAGWFTRGILFASWFILFMWMYRMDREVSEAFAVSSYVISIMAFFLWLGGMLEGTVTFISILGLVAISTAWLFINRKSSVSAT